MPTDEIITRSKKRFKQTALRLLKNRTQFTKWQEEGGSLGGSVTGQALCHLFLPTLISDWGGGDPGGKRWRDLRRTRSGSWTRWHFSWLTRYEFEHVWTKVGSLGPCWAGSRPWLGGGGLGLLHCKTLNE